MLKKKIISVVLVIVMIMGMSVLGVSADVIGIEFEYPYYYIMSANTGRYLEMPTSLSQGAPLVTNPLSVNNVYIKRWYIVSSGSNDVSIIGAANPYGYGMSTYYLSVSAYPYPQDVSFGRFTLERVTYPSTSSYYEFSGTYTIKQGTDYVASNSNGSVYLTSTLGADCFWSFMNAFKGNANLFSFCYTDGNNGEFFDTTANDYLFETTLYAKGYNSLSHMNDPAINAHTKLKSSQVFVFRGHGGPGVLSFEPNWDYVEIDREEFQYEVGGVIGATNAIASEYAGIFDCNGYSIESIIDNSLADARCVMYIGCSTACPTDDSDNLVDMTYSKGAHFVMGTTATVKTVVNDAWLEGFISETLAGGNIQDAIETANYAAKQKYIDEFGNNSGNDGSGTSSGGQDYIYPIYYIGDTTQYLNIP